MGSHARTPSLSARIAQLEALVEPFRRENLHLRELVSSLQRKNAELEERLEQATTAEAIMRRARYGSTAPMPVMRAPVPRPRRRDRHGMHLVTDMNAGKLLGIGVALVLIMAIMGF